VETCPSALTDASLRAYVKQSVLETISDTEDRVISSGHGHLQAAVGTMVSDIAEALTTNTHTVPGTVRT